MISPAVLLENLREISERVRTVARGREVTLVAVSKTHPIEAIETLYRAGHRDFGESYVQELVAKAEQARARGLTGVRWHFIGHLQTNKVRQLVPHVAAVHSVDSVRLGAELAKRWKAIASASPLPVFVEINIDREPGKAGVPPEEARSLVQSLRQFPELKVLGPMCIPSFDASPEQTRDAFARLRALAHELATGQISMGQISMGMSHDFELAIAEGATHVRVGTAIFGERPRKT